MAIDGSPRPLRGDGPLSPVSCGNLGVWGSIGVLDSDALEKDRMYVAALKKWVGSGFAAEWQRAEEHLIAVLRTEWFVIATISQPRTAQPMAAAARPILAPRAS